MKILSNCIKIKLQKKHKHHNVPDFPKFTFAKICTFFSPTLLVVQIRSARNIYFKYANFKHNDCYYMLLLCSIVIKSIVSSVYLSGFWPKLEKPLQCWSSSVKWEAQGTVGAVSSLIRYYVILHGNDYNRSAALSDHTEGRTSSAGWMPRNRIGTNISVTIEHSSHGL